MRPVKYWRTSLARLNPQTVRRGLKEVGMKSVVKTNRPFLSKKHRKERMEFAIAHKDWTVEDWKRVIWSDETKINRFGSDGRNGHGESQEKA